MGSRQRKNPNSRRGLTQLPLCPVAQKTEVWGVRCCFNVKMGEKSAGLHINTGLFLSPVSTVITDEARKMQSRFIKEVRVGFFLSIKCNVCMY